MEKEDVVDRLNEMLKSIVEELFDEEDEELELEDDEDDEDDEEDQIES